MVKPPKSMQPEAVDLTKAGRKSGRAFQADSFHQYMARKIDLQRNQFGLVLPPPPPKTPPKTTPSPTVTSVSPSNSRKRPRPSSAQKSVTFAALPLQLFEPAPEAPDDNVDPHSMSAILRNLKMKHGKGCGRVLSRHGKRNSRPHKSRPRRELTAGSGMDQRLLLQQQDESIRPNEATLLIQEKAEDKAKVEMCPENDEEDESPAHQQQPPSASISIPTSPFAAETMTESEEATLSSTLKLRRERPDLFFLGIVVKVNGYTDPDNETLKRMLQRHGGDLETYETTRVTHIIAEHLSTAKASYIKQQKRPRPVVLPTWITDSVEAGKLLPHGDYLLEELQDKKSQVGIKDWFGRTTAGSTKKLLPTSVKDPPATKSGQNDEAKFPPAVGPSTSSTASNSVGGSNMDQCGDKFQVISMPPSPHSNQVATTLARQDSSNYMDNMEQSQQSESAEMLCRDVLPLTQPSQDDNCSMEEEVQQELETSLDVTSQHGATMEDTAVKDIPGAQVKESLDDASVSNLTRPVDTGSTTENPQGRTDGKYINGKIRTVGTDPNFLDSFFANSRLSFIGSYKQRTTNEGKAYILHSERDRPGGRHKRFIFHVDMDCFFANVVLRNYPQYRDKPVAISHHGKRAQDGPINEAATAASASEKSTSECATCNYHARKFGIKKGMFLGQARQLCPDLIVLHYDFAGYEEVSEQVLAILHRVAAENDGCVESVSCDEAYMELNLPYDDGEDNTTPSDHAAEIAESVRKEIFETTQCTASIGVAANKFLAKVGTDRVKPNGTFVVNDHREVLEGLKLRDLHGIGYRSEPKLLSEGLTTVQDVWDLGAKGESVLGKILGVGLGKKIYAFCHGRDDRQVKPAERKTIGAECNYGVRFDGPYGIDHFMMGLATEVEKRMEGVACKGTKLTLKIKQRKKGAKPPPKFLGHGSCHNLSKSMDVPGLIPTRDAKVFAKVGMTLFRELAVPLDDVRGMGMVISKLSSDDRTDSTAVSKPKGIASFFQSGPNQDGGVAASKKIDQDDEPNIDEGHDNDYDNYVPELSSEAGVGESPNESYEDNNRDSLLDARADRTETSWHDEVPAAGGLALPPLSQICMAEVEALPPELQEEIRIQMLRAKRETSRSREVSPVPIDVDAVAAGTAQVASATSCKDAQSSTYERQHFRQTSLKRMMKLAAKISGQDHVGGIPVADFKRLPLELQLQIANDDSSPVGLLSQKPRSTISSGQAAKKRSAPTGRQKEERAAASATQPKSKQVIDVDLMAEQVEQTEISATAFLEMAEQEDDGPPAARTDLFEDDILPLQHFLDENTPRNPDAVNMVSNFFRTCLAERRMNAIPPLVRSIKKRTDHWGEREVMLEIVHGLDEDHETLFRSRLDIDWLLRE